MVRKVEFEVEAKDKSDDVDKSIRRLQEAKKASDDTSFSFGKLNSNALSVAKGMASVGSTLAGVTALSGPAIVGLVKAGEGLVALGHGAVGLAPLVAFLPGIVGGLELISGTAKLAGPGLARAWEPITSQFENTDKHVGAIAKSIQDIASKGVRPIAEDFAKNTLPIITKGMQDIAHSFNFAATVAFDYFANTKQGQNDIRVVVEATSAAFGKLSGSINNTIVALGDLAGVGGDIAIKAIGDAIGDALNAFNHWAYSLTRKDVQDAVDKLAEGGRKMKEAFGALKDVGEWMANNQQRVRDFSDAVAVLGVVLGVLSGNYIGAALSGFSLLINHWGDVQKEFTDAKAWWNEVWTSITTNPNFRAIVGEIEDIGASLRDDLLVAWKDLQPAFQKTAELAQQAWTALQPMVVQFFKDPTVIAGLKAIGISLAAAALAFVTLSGAAVVAAGLIVGALTGLAVYVVGAFAQAILGAIELLIRWFGQFESAAGAAIRAIPGLGNVGKAMQDAGNSAQGAADKVKQMNDRLAGLNSKTITVRSDFIETHSIISTQHAVMLAGGGLIPGAPSTVDTVPLMAARGEFVVNSAATARNLPLLRAINGDSPVAGGGTGPGGGTGTPAGASGGGGTVNVYVTNAVVGNEDALTRTIIDAIRRAQGRGYGPAFG